MIAQTFNFCDQDFNQALKIDHDLNDPKQIERQPQLQFLWLLRGKVRIRSRRRSIKGLVKIQI